MGKTAIVLGATGLVGKSLVDQLATAGHIEKVVAVTRRPFTHAAKKVTNAVVDFENLEKHAGIFTGDYLFSALGTTLKQAGTIEAQRKVDFTYQLEAARLAAKNGVEHYLLVSAAMADAKSRNPYIQMKGELEDEVLKLPFKRISIFQPSLLVGDRPEVRFGEKIAGLFMPALKYIPGLSRFRPIRGEEVAKKMVQVTEQPGDARQTFQLDEVFLA